MRRFALLLPLAAACSFDATGFGAPPAGTSVGAATETGGGAGTSDGWGVTGEASGGTTGASGSGSISASGTTADTTDGATSGPGTSGPGTTTGPGTTGPGTTGPGETTEAMSTGQPPCEMMMVWVDADGDGYGDPNLPMSVCVGEWQGFANNPDDCNDMSPAAGPNKPEVCDKLDNDCDGKIDEFDPVTNKDGCNNCAYRVRESRLYYFCNFDAEWGPARQFCMNQGLDLAIDSDAAEHNWLVSVADGFDGWGALRWIGGHREGGAFKWVDGSTVPNPDSRWFGGEPNNQGLPFDYGADCMVLVSPGPMWGKLWLDYTCGTDSRFICEGPLP